MRDPTASWYVIEEAGPNASAEDPAGPGTDSRRSPRTAGGAGAPEGPGDPGALGALGALGGGPAVVRLALAAAAGAVVAAALVLAVGGTGGPAVAVDAIGAGASASKDPSASPGAAGPAAGAPTDAGSGAAVAPDLTVDVEGAVLHPGIVRLPGGARVGEAIAAAGGYAPSVDVDRAPLVINLAAPVADGDRIRVPAVGDSEEVAAVPGDAAAATSAPGGGSGPPGSAAAGPLDLNQATQAELEALPGIGPVTALKIIEARASARFTSVAELRDRKLVGAATYAKIAPLVTVGP